jgi:hypothetical protein
MTYNHSRTCKPFVFTPNTQGAKNVDQTLLSVNCFMSDPVFTKVSTDEKINFIADAFGLLIGVEHLIFGASYEKIRELYWTVFKRSEEYDNLLKNGSIKRNRNYEKNYEKIAQVLTDMMKLKLIN